MGSTIDTVESLVDLARARTPDDLRLAASWVHGSLGGDAGESVEAKLVSVKEALARAISAVPNPDFQHAATALFDDAGYRPLGERRREAARALRYSHENFRKRIERRLIEDVAAYLPRGDAYIRSSASSLREPLDRGSSVASLIKALDQAGTRAVLLVGDLLVVKPSASGSDTVVVGVLTDRQRQLLDAEVLHSPERALEFLAACTSADAPSVPDRRALGRELPSGIERREMHVIDLTYEGPAHSGVRRSPIRDRRSGVERRSGSDRRETDVIDLTYDGPERRVGEGRRQDERSAASRRHSTGD